MIHGVGTDLLRMDRVERLWARYGAHFARKVLMPSEIEVLAGHAKPANAIAKAFAAKEAFVKALGTGFRDGVTHQDVGLARGTLGRPQLCFSAAMQARLSALGVTAGHVSLSDEDGHVLAFVVLERVTGQAGAPAP